MFYVTPPLLVLLVVGQLLLPDSTQAEVLKADFGNSTSCTPGDFKPTCSLICYVGYSSSYQPVTHKFVYYTTNTDVNVELDASWLYNSKTSKYNLAVQLSDYNAGTYRCLVGLRYPNDTVIQYLFDFKIDQSLVGVGLNGQCNYPQSCSALNAACSTDGQCQCSGAYSVPYNSDVNTPACLPVAKPGERCYNSDQCQRFQSATTCNNQMCVSTETVTTTTTPTSNGNNNDDSLDGSSVNLSTSDILLTVGVALGGLTQIILVVLLAVVAAKVRGRRF